MSRRLAMFAAGVLLAILLAPVAATRGPHETTIEPVTLAFEKEGLDLDNGAVVPLGRGRVAGSGSQPDFKVTWNSERATHAVVVPDRRSGAALAFLGGVPFDMVGPDDLEQLSFTAEADTAFGRNDSIVLRTGAGAYYLLGNPTETSGGVTFDTRRLDRVTLGVQSAARVVIGTGGIGSETQPRTASPTSVPPAWVERARLTGSAAEASDRFGYSVALSVDVAVVGAYQGGPFFDPGSANVFERSGATWFQRAYLTTPFAGGLFGWSVGVSGDTLVVGETRNGQLAGVTHVYVSNGTYWCSQQRFTPGTVVPQNFYAWSVAISGDTIVVGAPYRQHSGGFPGSAFVFVRSGSMWTQQAELEADDASHNDLFSWSVAISGDTIVVGAPGEDPEGVSSAGAAYVFVRWGDSWAQQAKLTASDAALHAQLGYSVAIEGNTIITGADRAGRAYAFTRNPAAWFEQVALVSSQAGSAEGFGTSVGVDGDTAIVGADDDRGAAYVFTRNGTSWTEPFELLAGDGQGGDGFGHGVAVSGNSAIVGAPGYDQSGKVDAGAAYVFSVNQPPTASCTDIVIAADPDCTAGGSIDSGSTDPDGDPLTLTQLPSGPYGLGTTPVTLIVEDESGATGSCMATVTVEDTTPPVVSCSAFVAGGDEEGRVIDFEATDLCGAVSVEAAIETSCGAVPVTDGQVAEIDCEDDDCELELDDGELEIEADLASLVVTATDAYGNEATCGVLLCEPIELELDDDDDDGTVLWWNKPAVSAPHDVIRGRVSLIGNQGSLGDVLCIENDSADGSTAGQADPELPGSGEAFFYLVAYDDGIAGSYGVASDGTLRVPGTGVCSAY